MNVKPNIRSHEIAVELAKNLPKLSTAERRGLSEWLLGVIILKACSLSGISGILCQILGEKENTIRQRLREFYQPAPRKRGRKRMVLRTDKVFADLLRWILRLWRGTTIVLALDVVLNRDKLAVICLSVVYRGCAIPIAWKVMPANRKGAWLPAIKKLLRQCKGIIPKTMKVVFLSDRGLWSPEIFSHVRSMKWHPMMRVQAGGCIRVLKSTNPKHTVDWHRCSSLIQRGESAVIIRGLLFKNQRITVTLLACWEQDHKEAWFIATDLAPRQCHIGWYGLRMWIEQGFKCTKSAGCDWEHSRITDPARGARMWLVYAVSALWFQAVATTIEISDYDNRSAFPEPLKVACNKLFLDAKAQRPRSLRLYRRGQFLLLALLLLQEPLILPTILVPEPLTKPLKTSLP